MTAESGSGGGPRRSFAAAWFFYDDDRFPDLYVANDFGENVVLRNNGNGGFEDVSRSTGATAYATAMGVATGDLDDDGSPEIYVANMYSKMGRRILDAPSMKTGAPIMNKPSSAGEMIQGLPTEADLRPTMAFIGSDPV